MKISVPHIHKIEGEAGFFAKVSQAGKVEDLKVETLEGLRQIEGILIGRKYSEIPLVVARICGICPVVHTLNACSSLEKILNIEISPQATLLRKLMLIGQIIESHTLHLFFMTLADFFDLKNDLDLMKKFPKETKATLKIRNFSLEIVKIIGGRAVHPMTPKVGGFSKLPEKKDLEELLTKSSAAFDAALILVKLFQNLKYPDFSRQTNFASLFSKTEYAFYKADRISVGEDLLSFGDFYSNKIEEDFKTPPVKKVKYQGKPYMLGAIARMKNNGSFLNFAAKKIFWEFKKEKKDIFSNIFYNPFYQALEILHFVEESQKLLKEILGSFLNETLPKIEIKKGSGLSVMEAPRGTLFTYFELDENGRVLDCNIITPTAQFLNNLEEDLKLYLPNLLALSEKERIKKIRTLIRVYDPCISCATH